MNEEKLNMKEFLEKVWLCVQILAVIGATYWGLSKWMLSDSQLLEPHIIESVEGVSAIWVDEEKTTCSISALWKLENKGKTPVEVSGITYRLKSVPFIDARVESDNWKDASLGNLLNKSKNITIEPVSLKKDPDTILASGAISRDIMIRYNPGGNDSATWFQSNRLTLHIVARVSSNIDAWWCPYCEKTTYKSEIFTSLKRFCVEEKTANKSNWVWFLWNDEKTIVGIEE